MVIASRARRCTSPIQAGVRRTPWVTRCTAPTAKSEPVRSRVSTMAW